MKLRKLTAFLLALCLILGSASGVFAASSQGKAENVTLVKYDGTVKLSNASGKAVSVSAGRKLFSGYTVETGADGTAYISLDSSKALMLEPSSRMILKVSGNKIDVMLETGTVVSDIAEAVPKNQTVNVQTINAVTGIRGTGVEVSYDPKVGSTTVNMLEGATENYSKFADQSYGVDAGNGIVIGGGAANVTVTGGSVAFEDLSTGTQCLVVGGELSDKVQGGVEEAFGLVDLSDEERGVLKESVEEAAMQDALEDQAIDNAALWEADELVFGEETTGTAIDVIDEVFGDQEEAAGTGAGAPADGVVAEDPAQEEQPAEPADSGALTPSDPNSGSGDPANTTSGAVSFTVPASEAFCSVAVSIDGADWQFVEDSAQTFTATPSAVDFRLLHESSDMYTVTGISAKVGNSWLTEMLDDSTETDHLYHSASGSFDANGTFNATIALKIEDLTGKANEAVTSVLNSIASSQIFSEATVQYCETDAPLFTTWSNNSKFSFSTYAASGQQTTQGAITITVPSGGGFFTVGVTADGESLAGTEGANGEMLYTADADAAVRFVLIPSVSESFWHKNEIGPYVANAPNGAGFGPVNDGSDFYTVEATGFTEDYTFRYQIEVTLSPEALAEHASEVESLCDGLRSDLFSSAKVYSYTADAEPLGAYTSGLTTGVYHLVDFVSSLDESVKYSTQYVIDGETAILDDTIIDTVPTDYTFAGWNLRTGGSADTGYVYTGYSEQPITADTTIYAVFNSTSSASAFTVAIPDSRGVFSFTLSDSDGNELTGVQDGDTVLYTTTAEAVSVEMTFLDGFGEVWMPYVRSETDAGIVVQAGQQALTATNGLEMLDEGVAFEIENGGEQITLAVDLNAMLCVQDTYDEGYRSNATNLIKAFSESGVIFREVYVYYYDGHLDQYESIFRSGSVSTVPMYRVSIVGMAEESATAAPEVYDLPAAIEPIYAVDGAELSEKLSAVAEGLSTSGKSFVRWLQRTTSVTGGGYEYEEYTMSTEALFEDVDLVIVVVDN